MDSSVAAGAPPSAAPTVPTGAADSAMSPLKVYSLDVLRDLSSAFDAGEEGRRGGPIGV
jgi:hypothetical protein